MKIPKLAVVILLGLIIWAGYQWISSRQLKGKLAEKDGEINILRADNERIQAEKNGMIDSLNTELSKKEADIKVLISKITVINTVLSKKDKELNDIRSSWVNLSVECQAKLHELDDKWSEKYSTLEEIVTVQDKEIKNLNLQIEDYKRLVQAWTDKCIAKDRMISGLQAGYDSATSRVKFLQLTTKLEYGLGILGIVVGHFVWKS
jgi:chromosome segregation ATPase